MMFNLKIVFFGRRECAIYRGVSRLCNIHAIPPGCFLFVHPPWVHSPYGDVVFHYVRCAWLVMPVNRLWIGLPHVG